MLRHWLFSRVEITFIMPENAISIKAIYREADNTDQPVSDQGTKPAGKTDNTVLIIIIVSLFAVCVMLAMLLILSKKKKTTGRTHE